MPTKEDIIQSIDDLLLDIDREIDRSEKSLDKSKSLRCLRYTKKSLLKIKKDIPKMRKKINRTDYSNSSFTIPLTLSQELSKFLQIDNDIKLSRSEVQCALSAYINIKIDEDRDRILKWDYLNKSGRDLRDETNGLIIIPDEKLSNLLNYEQYKNDVEKGLVKNKKGDLIIDDTLTYNIMIKLIQAHFN